LYSEHRFLWVRGGACWLRHCSTSRNVAGSIHDGVTGIFLLT